MEGHSGAFVTFLLEICFQMRYHYINCRQVIRGCAIGGLQDTPAEHNIYRGEFLVYILLSLLVVRNLGLRAFTVNIHRCDCT